LARYSNPTPQILDSNGNPVVGAKTYFFEPGTTTLKTVYSDSDFSTAIANPVLSLSGGYIPDVFLDGVYKAVQKDENDVTIWSRDPIGEVDAGQFDPWINDKSYSFNDIVKGSDLAHYKSLVAGTETNQGNDPISSPTQWGDATFVTEGKIASLNTKILNIGTWDMDATASVSVAHGVTLSKIRTINVIIQEDGLATTYDMASAESKEDAATGSKGYSADSTNIVLNRLTGGKFDINLFDDTSINRGWITIQYTD